MSRLVHESEDQLLGHEQKMRHKSARELMPSRSWALSGARVPAGALFRTNVVTYPISLRSHTHAQHSRTKANTQEAAAFAGRTVKLLRGALASLAKCRKCMSETRDQSYSCSRFSCRNCTQG